MSNIQALASDLYDFQGGQTARELNECDWNDDVGKSIKTRIEQIVYSELEWAKKQFGGIENIKVDDIEQDLSIALNHLCD